MKVDDGVGRISQHLDVDFVRFVDVMSHRTIIITSHKRHGDSKHRPFDFFLSNLVQAYNKENTKAPKYRSRGLASQRAYN